MAVTYSGTPKSRRSKARVSLRAPPSASLRAPPNASLRAPPTFLKCYPCVFVGIRRYLCDGSARFPKPAYFTTPVVTAALLLSIYIYMCVCVSIDVSMCVYLCMYVCMYVCMYACMYVSHVCMQGSDLGGVV